MLITASHFYSLYSPSFCELRLYLGEKGVEPTPPGPFAQLLFELGRRHERRHWQELGRPQDYTGRPHDDTVAAIRDGCEAIYQGELRTTTRILDTKIEVIGIPDFMIKTPDGYVIRDCKLARHASETDHPEIGKQLQVYGWLFEQRTGHKPVRLEVLKGDGGMEVFAYTGAADAEASIRELLNIMTLDAEPYSPVGWTKCGGCGYRQYCMDRAIKDQDVALVYDLDQGLARRLHELGVRTIAELIANFDEERLAELKRPWGAREQKVGKKAAGILMQARAMLDKKERVIQKPNLPVAANYVMFDLEGLPPQLDELDKIYLWGMQVFGERPGAFRYALAAVAPDSDRKCWEDFLGIAEDIFEEYGDIPFVHWHHYEKTKITAYIARYGDRAGIAARVLANLVDLLPITRASVVLPEPSYSLKVVEKYIGFKRTQDEYGGEWSIAKYIEAVETDDEAVRKEKMDEILKYNEEDLLATWAVMGWVRGSS